MQPIIEPVAFTSVWELLTALAFVIISLLLVVVAYYCFCPTDVLCKKVEK